MGGECGLPVRNNINPMLQSTSFRIIAGGITIISLSYMSYQMWRRYFKTPKDSQPKAEDERRDAQRVKTAYSSYSDYYFDKEDQLRKIIALVSDKGPTIEEVYLLSPRILVDEYLKYTAEIRKRTSLSPRSQAHPQVQRRSIHRHHQALRERA